MRWIPELCLYQDDKKILKSQHQWINDAIVNSAQKLLSISSDVSGLQNTQLGKNLQFKSIQQTNKIVQVLHVNSNHWITVSNINSASNSINIYDSLYNYISFKTKKQISSFMKFSLNDVHFCLVNVEQQKDGISCGYFALAFATELCAGQDPALVLWDTEQFRSHLLSCLESKVMSPFPKLGKMNSSASAIKRIINDRIICICHTLIDHKLKMFQCKDCNKLYHHSCCKACQCKGAN